MIPIVEYPSIVASSIPWFEDVFTTPQLRNFKTYVSGEIGFTMLAYNMRRTINMIGTSNLIAALFRMT